MPSTVRVVSSPWLLGGCGALLGIVLVTGGVVGEDRSPSAADKAAALEHARGLSLAFRGAVNRIFPAVVTIETVERRAMPRRGRGGPQENPFRGTPFEEFFNDEFSNPLDEEPSGTVPQNTGTGSGVIIDASGIILTNNHVVAGADEVVVRLADGREFKGIDIRTDPQTDLAIVRIEGAGTLPAATIGDSNQLELGDWVIAVGAPFGLEQTVSAGIISGKGREIGAARRARFLQTDAAINPGNSGGPLVNLEGEVIGINTAIASGTGHFEGIGFAIPSDVVRWVVPQLQKSGEVRRAYLGVGIEELTPELAESFGVAPGSGVLVAEIFPDSPASKAGLVEGDIIQSFAGTPVHNPRELQELVERTELDKPAPVVVLRSGATKTFQVAPAEMPRRIARGGTSGDPKGATNRSESFQAADLGLRVTNLTDELAEQLGYEGQQGVVVTQVDPRRPGRILTEGVLITRVGSTPVTNVEEFERALEGESLERGIRLLVRTGRGNLFVVLKADDK